MFHYLWPIALVVLSNTVYHVCAKSMPVHVNPFASLTITYLVGTVCSLVMYFATNRQGNFLKELVGINWVPFVLGLTVVGMEAGVIYAYKAGWTISTASIVQSSFLAVILIFVGMLLYREALTWNKIVGILICLVGLVFINLK